MGNIEHPDKQTTMSTPVDNDLRDRQAAFVREYCIDFNATQAYIRAGYSAESADVNGPRLLGNDRVRAAIDCRIYQIAAIAEVDAAMVVRELLDVATADPRELVQVTRDCCRWCWGIEHNRQWTRGEYDNAIAEALAAGSPTPELAGGIGYDARREPHADCPECFGRGIETILVTDTRKLTGKAAKLYAGAQQTKEGVKALGRDQNAALMALGRYLGMFTDKTQLSGPGGGPMQVQGALLVQEMSMEQLMIIAAQGAPKTIEVREWAVNPP